MLKPGLYEQVINNKMNEELADIPAERQFSSPIDQAEAAGVLTQYLSGVIQKGDRKSVV